MENNSQNPEESIEQQSGNTSAAQTDAGAENSEQNSGLSFGGAAPTATNSATAGDESTDEDAANPELAANDTSKSFDRDQQELETGLDDGDLDTDISRQDTEKQ